MVVSKFEARNLTVAIKIIHGIAAGLFLTSAVLQFNDPDPLVWIVYYAFGGIVATLLATGRRVSHGVAAFAGGGAILLLIALPGVIEFATNDDGNTLMQGMSKEYNYIEETREFGGALIALVWSAIAWFVPVKSGA